MLYLVTGENKKLKEYINDVVQKAGGAKSDIIRIHQDDLSDEKSISDLVVTQAGLFGDPSFYVITNCARSLSLKSILQEFQASENIIFFSEETVTKKILSDFEAVGAQVQVYDVPKKPKKVPAFNVFSLADALGRRDKKNIWLLYTQARKYASVEEINGILLWQLKNMVMVATAQGSSVEGMKPFVFSKNQGFVKNYSLEEMKDLMKQLTMAFHNRDTYYTLAIQVERILLAV